MGITEAEMGIHLRQGGGLGAILSKIPDSPFRGDAIEAVRRVAEPMLAGIPLAEQFGNYQRFVQQCEVLAARTPSPLVDPYWAPYVACVQKVASGEGVHPQFLDSVIQQCAQQWISSEWRVTVDVGMMMVKENEVLRGKPISTAYGVDGRAAQNRLHFDDGHSPTERRDYARLQLRTFLEKLGVE